jgi:hypothetical protein
MQIFDTQKSAFIAASGLQAIFSLKKDQNLRYAS